MTEDGCQRTEDRGQKRDYRGQKKKTVISYLLIVADYRFLEE
jgi:hypothetical protein